MKLIIAFCFALFILQSQSAPIGDLYFPDDAVEFLNVENFKSIVKNSTSAWLVEFYASWCGHCQRFAPLWREFAKDVASWRDVVRVGVVECSDERNTELCSDLEIAGYPTVKYFHERYESESGDVGVVVHYEQVTVENIKKSVIQRFITEINEKRGVQYPNLLPYNHVELDKLLDDDDLQFGILVADKSGGILGAEVVLDIHKTPNITVRYSFDDNADLIKNLKIENLPSLVILDRNKNSQVFSENVSNRHELKKTLATFLENKGIKLDESIPSKIQNSTDTNSDPKNISRTILRQIIKKMGDVVFQTDLEAALRYSLHQEIATVKSIKDEQLQALNSYLKVIKKYFPFAYNRTDFITKLTNLTASEQVAGDDIQLLVNEAEADKIFSSPQRFLGCAGSSSRFRGYPCSLWHLFHYLTVNSVQFNVDNKKADPREVLDAVLGYVKNFFSCKHCSEHFQEMAKTRNLNGVSSLEESIIWLWEAHNVVNDRLKGDLTEDPEYPKVQFPTKQSCFECYGSDGEWRKDEVLKYLKRMYSRYNVRYIGVDTTVLFPGLD